MKPRTLWLKLLWGVLPLTLLFVSAVGLGAYALARVRILAGIQRDVDSTAGQLASQLGSFFLQRRDDLEALTEVPLFGEAFFSFRLGQIERGERQLKEIETYLARFVRRARAYDKAALLDAQGRELAVVEWGRVTARRSTTPPPFLAQVLKGRTYRSELAAGPGGPSLTYAAPIADPGGDIQGAVVLECDLVPVLASLNRPFHSMAGAYLQTASGEIVVGKPPVLEGPLSGRAPIPDTPWSLVYLSDSAPYLEPLRDFGRWMAAMALLTGALLTGLLAWRLRATLSPLHEMETGARRLAEGDLTYRFSEPDTAELEALAREFNELARSLQKRNKEVEAHIAQLQELYRRMFESEKLSAMGRLIAGIAHELNNPLQSVAGYSEFLSRQDAPPSADDLRRIYDNAMLCCRIIQNLLLFVRQGEVVKRPVRVEEALKASLELLEYKLTKAADIDVVKRLPPDLPRVRADFQQLEQVLVNLLGNACDAMAGQETPKRITIEARAADGKVRLEISDTGPGIAPQARERLFEAFFTTKPEGQGTGLGLTICRQIVEEHGGRIGVEPGPSGAKFWLELPVLSADGGRAKSGPGVPAARGRSILVVEDNPDIALWLRRALERRKHKVATALSLPEAAAASGDSAFDLVISDIALGGASALSLYDDWKGKGSRPAFLFITGDVLNSALAQALASRGLTVLHKPISIDALEGAVDLLLARERALR